MDNTLLRKKLWRDCRQVVVKAGTRLLTDPGSVGKLVAGIAALRQRGLKVMLVSSGAVGVGMKVMKLARRPKKLPEVQALAAIGQSKLMALYDEECRKHGFASAQLLLTSADLCSRDRYLHCWNCINALWEMDVLPIVNENDSVSIAEIKYGDNDTLAGLLATMTGSSLTVILTTEEGLRERNGDGTLGARISVVDGLEEQYFKAARGTDNAELSIGGMTTKLNAARVVTEAGEYLWIADGRVDGILEAILNGEDVGTLFLPGPDRMSARKRWIRYFADCNGILIVDAGAAEALRHHGKSLLPSGIVEARGDFKAGDIVEIRDTDGRLVGRGVAEIAHGECERLHDCKGCVAVHRDKMVTVRD